MAEKYDKYLRFVIPAKAKDPGPFSSCLLESRKDICINSGFSAFAGMTEEK
ncbi:MAG: hypothetical protein KKA99_01710 [Gammaproteobacteria bacterium]|nr:hypothetical protein [Gammaproteobacteria bacterium]MBU2545639.1 hypothetical protein [Gammaproteobacteria bacterium]